MQLKKGSGWPEPFHWNGVIWLLVRIDRVQRVIDEKGGPYVDFHKNRSAFAVSPSFWARLDRQSRQW